MSTSEVVLITRVRTNNKGNQALSAAWVAMLELAFPGAKLRLMERRPRHLLQYTLEQFARARDPFRAFDAVTTELARLAPGPDYIGPVRDRPAIALDETLAPAPRFAALRQRLNLRRWAARAGRYREEYRRRLAACQRAQLVVQNPAGEFFPEDPAPALYHLLDLHVAHKLGRPTAIVNHTLDITDPTLRRLIPPLYRAFDLVGFRDEKSVDAFRAMGGDAKNVLVTPDLAVTTKSPSQRTRTPGTVAIAIHTPAAAWSNRSTPWIDVITGLKTKGFNVVLVSNELPSDQAFFDQVRQRVSVPLEGARLDYDRYSEMLGGFDFVVSSRMHTSILAMVAGTPVIPVEGPSFKISGLFQELGLTAPVIQPTVEGWTDRIIERAVRMREQRDGDAREVVAKIGAARERITAALVPRLQQAAGHA
jgi:polysaccharide pyruvyl transferase WcaK-like protein